MLMREKNQRSREHAAAALNAYRGAHTGGNFDTDDVSCIGDLIADLLHLAEDRGVLPSEMDDYTGRALMHYEHEADPDNAETTV